jgi:hypothetical protein
MAKKLLSEMNAIQTKGIVGKQIARTVLAKQTQFVNDMVGDGLLTTKDAEIFYAQISADVKKVERRRDEMNREVSKKTANLLRSTITSNPANEDLSLRARLLDD